MVNIPLFEGSLHTIRLRWPPPADALDTFSRVAQYSWMVLAESGPLQADQTWACVPNFLGPTGVFPLDPQPLTAVFSRSWLFLDGAVQSLAVNPLVF